MSAYSKSVNLSGFAKWFYVQYQEEMMHAMKIFEYVYDQGEKVILKAIEQPPKDFSFVADMFEKTLEHEKKVTKMINDLVNLAKKENDNATNVFLQWFVTEQVEEEANAVEILEKVKLMGKSGSGILLMDSKLGERKFNQPE
jgi:ferritin